MVKPLPVVMDQVIHYISSIIQSVSMSMMMEHFLSLIQTIIELYDGKDMQNKVKSLLVEKNQAIEPINDCLLISEERNRRVMRWSLAKNQ